MPERGISSTRWLSLFLVVSISALLASFSYALGDSDTRAKTSTTIGSSLNPSAFGQLVTYTASVTSRAGIPSGTVTFKGGDSTLGSATLNRGQATLSTPILKVGVHSVTAVYQGDASFATSTSAPVLQTVKKEATLTRLNVSADSSTFGQAVNLTASVFSKANSPTGNIAFKDGVKMLGAGTLTPFLQAKFSTSSLDAGTHAISAVYMGDGSFATSQSTPVKHTVIQQTTSTQVASNNNPSKLKQVISFTVAVSPKEANGRVVFYDSATSIGTTVLKSGSASIDVSSLAAGSHSITAKYMGSVNFRGSSSAPLNQVVR